MARTTRKEALRRKQNSHKKFTLKNSFGAGWPRLRKVVLPSVLQACT